MSRSRSFALSVSLCLVCTGWGSNALAQAPASADTAAPQQAAPQQAAPQQAAPQQGAPQQGYPQQGYSQGYGQPPPVQGAQGGWNGAPPPPGYGYGYAMPPPEPTERTANNALYIELLGAGGAYSLNYDRAFGDFAARVGLGYFTFSGNYTYDSNGNRVGDERGSFLAVPITVSYLGLGNKKHMFELGAGLSIWHFSSNLGDFPGTDNSRNSSQTLVLFTPVLGYRLQPPGGGFFLRVGFTPLINSYGFVPWPHVGLGATF